MSPDASGNVVALPTTRKGRTVEDVRNDLEIKVLPTLAAIEVIAEAMRALGAFHTAAEESPAFAKTLRKACPDYRNAYLTQDTMRVVADLARLAETGALRAHAIADKLAG